MLFRKANNTHTLGILFDEHGDLTFRESNLTLGGEITLCYTSVGYFSTL